MQTLDKHFRALAGSIFQRHGFAQADVLSHWPEIMGPELARICLPERIRWPRAGELANSRGATLSVKAYAGEALTVQYAVPQMLERLNSFLGHGAITRIKIDTSFQVRPAKPAPRHETAVSPALLARLSPIADDDLQAALAKLGMAVNAKSQRSPQAKQARGLTP
jgi:hypothetical protein